MPATYGVPVNTYACGKTINANCDSDRHRRIHKKSCADCKQALKEGAKEILYARQATSNYQTNDKKMEAELTRTTSSIAGQLATQRAGTVTTNLAPAAVSSDALAERIRQRLANILDTAGDRGTLRVKMINK